MSDPPRRRPLESSPFSPSLIYTPLRSPFSRGPPSTPCRPAASPPQTVSSAYNNNVEGVWTGPLSHPTPPPRRAKHTNTPHNAAHAMHHTSLTHARPTRAPTPSPPPTTLGPRHYIPEVVPARGKQCVGSEARGPGNICWAAVSVLLHK